MVRLLLADDHQVVRQGLRALLEAHENYTVVGEASDGYEAVELTESLRPDVLVLDLVMPRLGGLEVLHRLKEKGLDDVRIVVLTMQSNEAYVAEALAAGALAYVLKETGSQELLHGIEAAMEGRRYLSPPLSLDRLKQYESRRQSAGVSTGPLDLLTPREREVFKLVAEGNSNAEVAAVLKISPRTVEVHRANLMGKLGAKNQADLVRLAMENGILSMKKDM